MENKKLIALCEDLLRRARSGALEGVLIVELRQNERINCNFHFEDNADCHRAASFAGAALWKDALEEEIDR